MIWRAELASLAPSGLLVSMASSGTLSPGVNSSEASLSTVVIQRVAAMISGLRIWPSPSLSSICSVRVSNSSPEVGQPSTDHSF